MKSVLDIILDHVFDGVSDWYEVNNNMDFEQSADVVLQGYDAVAWIDNDVRDTVFGIKFNDEIETQITVLQSTDPETSLLDLQNSIRQKLRDLYYSGTIAYIDDVVCSTRGLTLTLTDLTFDEETPKLTAVEALDSKRTFYVKHWQSNGYYPIDKYKYNSETKQYERFVNKSDQWRSRGLFDYVYLKYIFEHNACIISFSEMTDTLNYNED